MQLAVLYNTAVDTPPCSEIDLTADCEILQTAAAIRSALIQQGHSAEMVRLDPENIPALSRFDWIFNLVESIHGYPYTEYEIARRMEQANLGFTGSGSRALKTCIDKAHAKRRMVKSGIPTPAFRCILPGQTARVDLSFPLFAKPVHEDASIGISPSSIIRTQPELEAKVREIHTLYNQTALVEEFIEGRDVMASILGNGPNAMVMPLSEIVYYSTHTGPKVLTYETKWVSTTNAYQNCEIHCPADLDDQTAAAITAIARQVFLLMGCQDYCRVDFRLRGQTPYVLEVNPNPCINPDDSGYLVTAQTIGLNYPDLIAKILELSLQRLGARVSAASGAVQL